MSERRVASRYAKSLIELAEEKGVLEEVNRDMQLFHSITKENRNLELALTNPIISNDKKLNILREIFQKKVTELTYRFFEIISRKNRELILPMIAEEFHTLYNEYKGVVKAKVITTFPLDEKLRAKFKAVVKERFKKEVELEESVDSSLIGGYILTVGDKQIDESLNSKLKALKLEFAHSHQTYIKEI